MRTVRGQHAWMVKGWLSQGEAIALEGRCRDRMPDHEVDTVDFLALPMWKAPPVRTLPTEPMPVRPDRVKT